MVAQKNFIMSGIALIAIIFTTNGYNHAEPLQTLGFPSNQHPSAKQIKQRFKSLSLQYHPDRNKDQQDQRRYEKIIAAYEQLKQNNFQTDEWRYENIPEYHERPYSNIHLDIDDILRDIELDLISEGERKMKNHKNKTMGQQRQEISINGFFQWCSDNFSMVLGAFLISFGVVNLFCKK